MKCICSLMLLYFELLSLQSDQMHVMAHNTKQMCVTHQSINQANNPFPQYTNQLTTQPIAYGYAQADEAHTKTLVPLSL